MSTPTLTYDVNETERSITIRPLREGEKPRVPFVIHATEYLVELEISGFRYHTGGDWKSCRTREEVPKEALEVKPFHSWQKV